MYFPTDMFPHQLQASHSFQEARLVCFSGMETPPPQESKPARSEVPQQQLNMEERHARRAANARKEADDRAIDPKLKDILARMEKETASASQMRIEVNERR